MARTLVRNHEHFRRALARLPLGVASNFRFWGEERTIYVKEGRGARVTDLDGNVYVDYRMGYGPAILGYADPRVDAAARAGMAVGGVFALSTEGEYRVAQRISQMVPLESVVSVKETTAPHVIGHFNLFRSATLNGSARPGVSSRHGPLNASVASAAVGNFSPARPRSSPASSARPTSR